MIGDYRVVTVTPSGRRRNLEILYPYLLREQGVIDVHYWCVNTVVPEDVAYIDEMQQAHPTFFQTLRHETFPEGEFKFVPFYRRFTDPDTIYVKIDDDVSWLGHDAVRRLVEFRIANPDFFLVFANTVNNPICSHIHQKLGAISKSVGDFAWDAFSELGWRSPTGAELVHNIFLEHLRNGSLDRYAFDSWPLSEFTYMPINFFAWFGADFARFNGEVIGDDEEWLTTTKPRELARPNAVCGDSLVVHFAFHTQRQYLEEETDLLQRYRMLVPHGLGTPSPQG